MSEVSLVLVYAVAVLALATASVNMFHHHPRELLPMSKLIGGGCLLILACAMMATLSFDACSRMYSISGSAPLVAITGCVFIAIIICGVYAGSQLYDQLQERWYPGA